MDAETYLAPLLALKLVDKIVASSSQANILLVIDDVVQHHFREHKVFNLADQPFSSVNLINEVYQKTGVFDKYTLTSMLLFDHDSSSLMFKADEISLEKNIDSLADQIIYFNTEDSKITKGFLP